MFVLLYIKNTYFLFISLLMYFSFVLYAFISLIIDERTIEFCLLICSMFPSMTLVEDKDEFIFEVVVERFF